MSESKPVFASKQIWFSIVLSFLGGVMGYLEQANVPWWVLLVIAAIVAGLRAVTSQPIGRSKPKDPDAAKTAPLLSIVLISLVLTGCGPVHVLSKPDCGPILGDDGPQLCCRYDATINGSVDIEGQRIPLTLEGSVAGCASLPRPIPSEGDDQ